MPKDTGGSPVVRIEREQDVAFVVIDNPPVNATSLEVRAGLLDAVSTLAGDDGVSAIVLIGAGKTFIAGADIREFGKPMRDPQVPAVIAAIEQCSKPVVAAIAGAALGGGFEIALGCDGRIATAEAMVGLPEVTLGIIPGAGGTQRLPRAVGKAKAMDMILTGRMMDAQEAERAGLAARVVPAEKLLEEALACAAQIAEFSLPSVMMAKEAVNRAWEAPLADGILFERRLFHSLFATEDQKEGMAAFLEKRKPKFRHR
jgi:enoyl-CoA hydratase